MFFLGSLIFYGGAGDTEPCTCFVSNSPLCMICKASDMLCEECYDIKDYLCTLLSAVQQPSQCRVEHCN